MRAIEHRLLGATEQIGLRVIEVRNAGLRLEPITGSETSLAPRASAAQDRYLLVRGMQNVDTECSAGRQRSVDRRRLVDTDEHGGRIQADFADSRCGHRKPVTIVTTGNDSYRPGETAQC